MSCNDHNISLFAFFTHLHELRTLPPIHEDLRKICNVPMLENCLPLRVLQKLCTDSVQGCTFGPKPTCSASLASWSGLGNSCYKGRQENWKFWMKNLYKYLYNPIHHLTHCSRKRHKQLQPAFTKWLHLTGVAKCDPEAGKCVKETPLKPLQPLHFIDSIQSDAQITCVSGIHLTHLLRRMWPQHHLGHLKSLRAQGLRSWVKHLAGHTVRHPRHPAVTAKMPLGHIHDAT